MKTYSQQLKEIMDNPKLRERIDSLQTLNDPSIVGLSMNIEVSKFVGVLQAMCNLTEVEFHTLMHNTPTNPTIN